MHDALLIVCMCACIICPLVALASILLSNYNINRRIRSIESEFYELYKASENRIDRTNEMVCKLAACMERSAEMLTVITTEYTRQLDKLQECRDRAMAQNADLAKSNTILTTVATTPRTTINNNAN